MGIVMKIHNVKSIHDFEFKIPTEKGLYALTGENGSGKSTVISCAATSFYTPLLYSYFGEPWNGSKIEFEYNGKKRCITSAGNRWFNPNGNLGITGFFEGSLVYGNRFKDIDFSMLKKLSKMKYSQLEDASFFIKENLGMILHDDKNYYQKLYLLSDAETKKNGLLRPPFYFENNGRLVSQLNMSTGENLLITILYSLQLRLEKGNYGINPMLILLDEIELALHSSALRRLVFFLKKLAEDNNFVVFFSTHSIELIRSIKPENIFYLQKYLDGSIEVLNPCYPVYATRNLESSNYGHDCIVMVEDELARVIVEKILYEKKLLSNKKVLVIAVGGWSQVLRFAYDTIRSNLALSTTQIITVLDRDIKKEAINFMKKEKIGFANGVNYLPIKSLEKYLLENLVIKVDHTLFKKLSDYIFLGKPLVKIVGEYNKGISEGIYTDSDRIKNGKYLYDLLKHELKQIRKEESELSNIIVEYLFENENLELKELTAFLSGILK